MESATSTASRLEPLSSLRPHPDNPRRGDIDAIARSLSQHGQYRPIVAQKSTRHILAGNHTWRAAKTLGWKHIAVTWLDIDDLTARKVLIADNRTADLASYDNDTLITLLMSIPNIETAGYDQHELNALTNADGHDELLADPTDGTVKEPREQATIRLGRYELWLTASASESLRQAVDQKQKATTVRHLRTLLGFPPEEPNPVPSTNPTQRFASDADLTPINAISPHPSNPRQGDIGAISESLRHLGQYRPIVVNRRTDRILVGNHTWYAARALGWTEINAVFIDVDENAENAILLNDNRTSDLATYDDEILLNLLKSTPLDGIGFSGDDLDELLGDVAKGRYHRRPAKTSHVSCRVLTWTWKVNYADFDAWDAHDNQYEYIAENLNLNPDEWNTESNP